MSSSIVTPIPGSIMWNEQFRIQWYRLRSVDSQPALREAICKLGDQWLARSVKQRFAPTRRNPSTGAPESYNWVPLELSVWDGQIQVRPSLGHSFAGAEITTLDAVYRIFHMTCSNQERRFVVLSSMSDVCYIFEHVAPHGEMTGESFRLSRARLLLM